VPILIL
jgi:hypothetical protein